ncbi:MAG: beta-N-acetylhexosaminidase [Clostridia bacterium]|nr:beta-N-acetylhexosaminidase [Clostridia bacterium]
MEVEKLGIEQKIGQMLIIALEEKEITEKTIDIIQKYNIGGIILYRKNYNTYEEMLDLINKLKEINKVNEIPLFISIDQEGGRVNRMPSEILNLESANKISKKGDITLVKESANIIGEMLIKTGINMNYSPVLDIKNFKESHAIGDRCYGENKEDVSKYGIEFMKELSKKGILPVEKHFPGHGATRQDSHVMLPIVTKSKSELENEHIEPFKYAIQNGAEAIMVGHILAKDIDKKYPASLSKKTIQEYLVKKLNFQGLIITDDLKMLAIRLRYSLKRAVILAINSGNNMIMIGAKYKKVERIIKKISKKVQKRKIDIDKINQSVQSIISVKKKYNINDNKVEGFDIEDINKKIKELNKKILSN